MASPSSLLQTPLHAAHLGLGGRMVDFAGWDMPVQYPGGILSEHQAVRTASGLFDLSHMGRVFVRGKDALALAQACCTRDLSRIPAKEAAYSVLCDDDGGIVDDVIAYIFDADHVLFVFNASNREMDMAFFEAHRGSLEATLHDATFETALIGIQGPTAQSTLQPLAESSLDPLPGYAFVRSRVAGADTLISRTGYTGEDGFELMVEAADAERVWNALREAGAVACGLGARDTLRTEAGFALYGHEIDRTTNPYEARLGWVVNLARPNFAGRAALATLRERGVTRRLVGLQVSQGGVPRAGAPIVAGGAPVGRVTSGTFSPSLRRNIAMGYVPVEPRDAYAVDIRGRPLDAEIVALPFVPHRSRSRAKMKA